MMNTTRMPNFMMGLPFAAIIFTTFALKTAEHGSDG
jgi:hypothetical protein